MTVIPPTVSTEANVTEVLQWLVEGTRSSRCTLRQDLDDSRRFPVTHEYCAPGVRSLRRNESVDVRTAPTTVRLLRDRMPIVIDDCHQAAKTDPDYQGNEGFIEMLSDYGGLRSFVVVPVFDGAKLQATISLHQLHTPRTWSEGDLDLCTASSQAIAAALGVTSRRDGTGP